MLRFVLRYDGPNLLPQYVPQMTVSNDRVDDVRSFCARPHNWDYILYDNMTSYGSPSTTTTRSWDWNITFDTTNSTEDGDARRNLQNYEEPEEEDPTFETTATNCTEEAGSEACPVAGRSDDDAYTTEMEDLEL